MKLDIYKLLENVTAFDYTKKGLKISIEKNEYISNETFIKNIKYMIKNIGTTPDKVHYNKGKIDIYYSGYSNIGFD